MVVDGATFFYHTFNTDLAAHCESFSDIQPGFLFTPVLQQAA